MTFSPLFGWFGVGAVVAILLVLCLMPAVRGDGPRWKWFVRMGVVVLLGLALARPGIATESTTEEYEAAADVYFLVDTTTSMAAEDYNGSTPRIEGVKADMLDLAEQLPGARLSIITFASAASTAMPLTTDRSAFAAAVDVLSPELSLNSNGSSITEAGDELQARMDSNAEDRPGSQNLVFYFGDGEQTAPGSPASWTSFASRIDSGAVFGYGTAAGGMMRESQPFGFGRGQGGSGSSSGDAEYIRDAQGNPGISRIDESNLQQLAADLGVEYRYRDGSSTMSSAYTAPTFEQQIVRRDGRITVDEYFWIPLIAVFGWIAVEMVLGVRELVRIRSVLPPRRGGRRGPQAPPPGRGGSAGGAPAGAAVPAGFRGEPVAAGSGPRAPVGSGPGPGPGPGPGGERRGQS